MARDPSRNNKALGRIDIGEGSKDFGLVFSRLISKRLRLVKACPSCLS